MTNVICEWVDDCVRIRLACGDANLLTTEVLRELSEAITVAESRGRGVLFCGVVPKSIVPPGAGVESYAGTGCTSQFKV